MERQSNFSGRPSNGHQTSNRQTGGQQTGRKRRYYKSHHTGHSAPSQIKTESVSSRQVRNYGFDGGAKLRIIPLGGCEEVGRNMTVFEYDKDIIILDMGVQFPEEDMPGIDYIIPNTKYLEGKEKNIKGVIFSHGHLDHIGAAPILLEKLGNPIIIGRDLTIAMIKHKQEDHQKGSAQKLKIITVKDVNQKIALGKFSVGFFQVEHSIMDAVGVVISTPVGTVIHPGDWTLDRDQNGKVTIDYQFLRQLKKPTVLMLESLGAVHEHRGVSYEEMYQNLQEIISQAPGRVIIGTFSSQIERIKWVMDAAQKLGKKVFLDGYSMKMNIEIAKNLGYIKINKGVLEDIKKVEKYDDKEIVVLCTGAQGEENAVLSRIVSGDHHQVSLQKNDTVVFSSSIIPGNERTIQRLKDNLYRQCDNVIHGQIMDVHVSGHATKDDMVEMIKMIQPSYFIPVYANHYMLKEGEKLAVKNGFPKENVIVPDNGSVIEVSLQGAKMLEEKVPSHYVFVDGLGVSDSQHVVLRDRQVLAEDGMVVVIVTVRSQTGQLVQNPDLISRGFVFLKDNKELIEDLRQKVKHLVMKSDPKNWADTNQIKNDIRDKVGQFLYTKTEKRPMVLPVVIEV